MSDELWALLLAAFAPLVLAVIAYWAYRKMKAAMADPATRGSSGMVGKVVFTAIGLILVAYFLIMLIGAVA